MEKEVSQEGSARKSERSLAELVEALTSSFSIGDYLELRRRFPEKDTALWMVMASDKNSPCFGLDFAFQLETDFKKWGIPVETFLGVLDGEPDDIDSHCLYLLEALSRREKLEREHPHAVAAGLAIGDAFVNFLCGAVLESLAYYELPPPNSYQVLLKCRLKLFDNEIKEQRVLKHRRVMVALLIADNPNESARSISRMTGLNASTISRWVADEDFMSYVCVFRAHPRRDVKTSTLSAPFASETEPSGSG
jgi:hypothetical protein